MITRMRKGATVRIERMRIDIDTNPTFTRNFGKKVRAFGGSYSRVTQWDTRRSVYLPMSPESIELADEIIRQHRPGATNGVGGQKVTVVFDRVTPDLPSQVTVNYMPWDHASVWTVIEKDFVNALALAVERGYVKTDMQRAEAVRAQEEVQAVYDRNHRIAEQAPAMLDVLRALVSHGATPDAVSQARDIIAAIDNPEVHAKVA